MSSEPLTAASAAQYQFCWMNSTEKTPGAAIALRRVWRYFRVKNDWNGKNKESKCVMPELDDVGTSIKFWQPGLRFYDKLPLRIDRDYSGTKIEDGEVGNDTEDGAAAEYMLPFGVIKHGTETEGRWKYIHALNDKGDEEYDPVGMTYAVQMQMQDECLGIILEVSGGTPQHVIAAEDFDGPDGAETDNPLPEAISWQDMQFTLFLLADEYAQQQWPIEASSDSDLYQTLVIDVPEARIDYVAEGTVVGIDPAGALITTQGGYVRDDREMLLDIARIAYEWYSVQRQAMDITLHTLIPAVRRGQLVATIGHLSNIEILNTIVTSITWNTRQGTHTVQTQFAELDAAFFSRRRTL